MLLFKNYKLPLTLLFSFLFPSLAFAGSLDTGDSAWILTSSALVLFMTLPGLALFYGGLVRKKNVLSILIQCFAITGVASLIWFVVGYSLAFGEGNAWIGDFSKVMLLDSIKATINGTIPETSFAFFQMTFAIITPALIIGAVAERMKFSAILLFSAIWLLIVYVPVTHWVWGGGWLAEMGVYDFAGGIVVHITAGVAALVAALVVGNRRGFGKRAMPPHNMTMVMTGAAMLWVGWFGFNGGSALSAGGDAAMAMIVTHLAAATGALTWGVIEWIKYGKPSALGIATGMVAGLGTITPASGFVGPIAAIIIGLLAGGVCYSATNYIKQTLKIDDSLDVFPVHGVGGILGSLLVGIFASASLGAFGGFSDINILNQIKVQFIGVFAVVVWTTLVTWLILKVLDKFLGLRVNADEEDEGLDIALHEETGYDL
jgi:Amt family ammonium transporter